MIEYFDYPHGILNNFMRNRKPPSIVTEIVNSNIIFNTYNLQPQHIVERAYTSLYDWQSVECHKQRRDIKRENHKINRRS